MSLSDDNASYREHIEGFILRHPIEPVLPVADVPLDPETVHGPRSYFDGRDDGKAAGYAEGFQDGWDQGREQMADSAVVVPESPPEPDRIQTGWENEVGSWCPISNTNITPESAEKYGWKPTYGRFDSVAAVGQPEWRRFTGLDSYLAIVQWMKDCGDTYALANEVRYSTPIMLIRNSKGTQAANPGDWIARKDGEFVVLYEFAPDWAVMGQPVEREVVYDADLDVEMVVNVAEQSETSRTTETVAPSGLGSSSMSQAPEPPLDDAEIDAFVRTARSEPPNPPWHRVGPAHEYEIRAAVRRGRAERDAEIRRHIEKMMDESDYEKDYRALAEVLDWLDGGTTDGE